MRLRKLLAMLLTLSMLISMVPSAAFAAETGSEPSSEAEVPTVVNPDNLFLDKTATLTGDGTYTIKLEAYATGTTITKTITEGVPLDVVLVMDQSGSLVSNGDMLTTLKSSVSSFLESLRANGEEFGVNHRVAICGFASHSKQNNSGLAADEYSYANDIRDNAWTNTGIFVDGEFLDYGTVEYTKITDPDDISTSNMYTIKGKLSGDDIYEYTTVRYSNGVWYSTVNGDTVAESGNYTNYGYLTATQALWLQYYVYTVGNSVNQLTDNDYAAAWENIADGENGQGSLNTNIATAVEHLSSNGATATFMGMKMARKMLENLPTGTDGVQRKKIVIVFTDGEPGPNGYAQGDAHVALSEAARIKDGGTEIYTIGIYSAASATTVETFMNWMSSNYVDLTYTDTPIKLTTDLFAVNSSASSSGYVGFSANGKVYYYRGIDGQNYGLTHYFIQEEGNYWPVCIRYDVSTGSYYARYITDDGEYSVPSPNEAKYYQLNTITPNSEDYYKHASNISELSGIFETISSDMTGFTSEVSLDANAVLKDVLADGFTLTDNTTITVSVVPGSASGDDITWGTAQEVLSFNYPNATEQSRKVQVSGAADQTVMTLTAKATADGVVTVTGFNYAKAEDANQNNAQYISEGHPGSKLVVTITGVEAKADISTNKTLATNKGTSGIYESDASDNDGDNEPGEMQAAFPIPTTHLTSKTYYLDSSNSVVIDPADFLMITGGINADPQGYHYFNPDDPGATIVTAYGTVTVREDGKVVYTMTADNWKNNDVFYLFGETTSTAVTGASANASGNMWSKIVIVPPEDIRGNLFLNKDAVLTKDGTYTIDLEAYATSSGTTRVFNEGVPLDVVLVMDQSGSLLDGDLLSQLKSSVGAFVNALYANGEATGVDHRVAICGFGSYGAQVNSGVVNDGLSYAGERQDLGWVNTGIFVDGQFRNYGELEYTKVASYEDIKYTHSYAVEYDSNNDGTTEIVRAYYRTVNSQYAEWYVLSAVDGQADYVLARSYSSTADAAKKLYENHTVYTVESSNNVLTNADYTAAWEYISDDTGNLNEFVQAAVDNLAANGATNTFMGMKMARKMLENLPAEADGVKRKQIVIVFTDGEPGAIGYAQGDADAALAEAAGIKNGGAEIYTIGIYGATSADKVESFMNQLSSNYAGHDFVVADTPIDPSKGATSNNGFLCYSSNVNNTRGGIYPYFYKDAQGAYWPVYIHYDATVSTISYEASYITDDGEVPIENFKTQTYYTLAVPAGQDNESYYKHGSSGSDLSDIFESITTEVTTFDSKISLDANAILKDVMADGFKLTDNTTITVSVVPGSVSEANSSIPADELTSDKIDWGTPKQVLSFAYPTTTEGKGKVTVNGAADKTEMSITATVSEDGVIAVTGFNYAGAEDENKTNAQYIAYGHPGSKLLVTITGVEAEADVTTDAVIATNKDVSGIYEGLESDIDGDDEKNEMQAAFPVPTTHITSKVYVVDYAKPVTIDPADFKMTIGAVSLDKDGYYFFDPAVLGITKDYGKVAVENGKLIYTPTSTNWDGYDTFYVFGTTEDTTITSATANRNGNMWAKVSVIPANNVYYEDTFVTNEGTGTAGIVYSGSWEEDGANGNQGEHAESDEDTATDDAQGSVHGWEDTLADDKDYSDGSAHKVSYDKNNSATATFTFTGTGVDIYSRTNPTTGIVIAMLYKGTSTTDADGKNLVAEKTLMVDNLAASGDYYQIPTLSLNGLEHGTYTVRIIVSKASDSQTGAERFIYYLDGIRVYNPIQNLEGNETVSGAYGEEELNANFVEIRDKLLDANSFSAEGDGLSAGPVFIDRITSEEGDHTDNTETWEVGTYKVFGPENEVYLSAGQMIAFAVEYREGAHYYIGMKSLTGRPAGVSFGGADGVTETISIGHTTDLYYEVYPVWKDDAGNDFTDENSNRIGIIMIQADSRNGDYTTDENGCKTGYEGSILALTKLKVTGPAAQTFKFAKVRNSVLLSHAADVVSSNESDAEDPGEGGENTDPTEPGTPDIENPEPEAPADDWDDMARRLLEKLLKKIFDDLRRWFKP